MRRAPRSSAFNHSRESSGRGSEIFSRLVASHTFDEPGELLIGCHVDGHYDAGMRGTFLAEK
ncbi:MAG TPA: hypothetical protein VF365_10425 [Candidatus Limnocylindria bacterium]